jgi:HSP20 family protein
MSKTIHIKADTAEILSASREVGRLTIGSDLTTPQGHGQLPIDILENEKEILLITPIAGVDIKDTEIVVTNDVLTIKGKREVSVKPFGFTEQDYFVQECFWGPFERSVMLPPNLDTDLIEATQKNMILFVRIPKKKIINMRIVKIKN